MMPDRVLTLSRTDVSPAASRFAGCECIYGVSKKRGVAAFDANYIAASNIGLPAQSLADRGYAVDEIAARLIEIIAFPEKDRDVAVKCRILNRQTDQPALLQFDANGMCRKHGEMIASGYEGFLKGNGTTKGRLGRRRHVCYLQCRFKHRMRPP